jgi:hypothetical protein
MSRRGQRVTIEVIDGSHEDLLAYTYADLREQFDTPKNCNAHVTIGCARTASATDQWRSQRGLADAALAVTATPG